MIASMVNRTGRFVLAVNAAQKIKPSDTRQGWRCMSGSWHVAGPLMSGYLDSYDYRGAI